MPIIEIFALAAPEFFAAAAPEISAEVLAAQTASAAAPEVIAATEAATATAPTAYETAQVAPEVTQAIETPQGIQSLEGLNAADIKPLTTPQGITQALTSPEAISVPGANAGAGGAGINALQTNAVNQLAMGPGQQVAGTSLDTIAGAKPIDVAGIQQITPAGGQPTSLQFAQNLGSTSDVGQFSSDKSILNMMDNYNKVAAPSEIPGGSLKVPGAPANSWTGLPDMSGKIEGIYPGANAPTQFNPNLSYASQVTSQTPFSTPVELSANAPTVNVDNTPSALERGFGKAMKFVENNPLAVAGGVYAYMNQPQAYQPQKRSTPSSLAAYRMSPNFQPSSPTPNVYRPRYAAGGVTDVMLSAGGSYDDEPRGDDQGYGFASGGIAGYATGKSVNSDYETYLKMTEAQKYPDPLPESVSIPRTGIMYDTDPDTRYKDALTASMIRMGKINKKAGYDPQANLQRPKVTLGQVETGPAILKKKQALAGSDDEREAAAGGIMQADRYAMGGYASGSVPRLLKGPGDGMSDDIPATIDGRQPARLADGEFVIPADVVSGLGNGSTDAGAKHLHKMMTDVRKARTGNPKQGKEIQAEKFMPTKKKRA